MHVGCVNGYETIFAGTQSAGIVFVDHGSSGKNHGTVACLWVEVFFYCDWKVLPMQHIFTHRMSPTHMPPLISVRIVLVEEMKFILVKNQTIWIVYPIFFRGKVKLGPVCFSIF